MWFKTTAEDGEGESMQWRAIEDCSTDERPQKETLRRWQWTDDYVERPETLMLDLDVDEAERSRRLASML